MTENYIHVLRVQKKKEEVKSLTDLDANKLTELTEARNILLATCFSLAVLSHCSNGYLLKNL